MDFEIDDTTKDPLQEIMEKYPSATVMSAMQPPNLAGLNTARGLQMDANALTAAGLNSFTSSANTANTATTGGNPITAADILSLPLTEEAKERIARENAVYDALVALRIALDNQDSGIEIQRNHNREIDEINAAYENGEIDWEERKNRLANAQAWADQRVKNNLNATTELTNAQQAVQDLGITRTEISDWDAAYSPSNPISPRLGTGATLWEKAGDVGSDVLSGIAEATDWTGEALGSVLGIGDPDQFGPTVPNLGVGWQWGATGKQTPVQIGTAKDGTPIVIYMPGGGFLGGATGAAQQGGGLFDILKGGLAGGGWL